MKIIENSKIKEKVYIEKLKNGLTVMIIPKENVRKKYIIWGTHYGSNDSKFIVPGDEEITEVPKGVAHFLEHKMFEQENGRNSLDVLTSLGVNANAYTTNDYTAYLYECTDRFYEALDEFMDYVQHPYFTNQNVEKEKGIIAQEIKMYDDYPEWKVYLNALEAMYHSNAVKLDITGTVETISKIDKEILYKCYNTFYNPGNMCLVVCGDFVPEELLKEIEKRLIDKQDSGEIKRIYEKEEKTIVKREVEERMDVSMPLFTIGIKLEPESNIKKVKKHIAIDILLNMLIGESSELYQNLYKNGEVFSVPNFDFEFGDSYSHILISGKSNYPNKVLEKLEKEIQNIKENGINKDDFKRLKKMIYGEYVKEYNDVSDIARMFLVDFMKGVNPFDYLEEIESVNLEYVNQVLSSIFDSSKTVFSVVKK